MPKMQLPKRLKPLITMPKRFKVIIGGRGSGKSVSVGDICLMDAQTKGIKTACFREYQTSIDDSVHALLSGEIQRLGLQGFDVQQQTIKYAGEDAFKFKGLARNPEGIKSMYGFGRFWVEEAQTISFNSLKALTPTMREQDGEIWFTGNPRSSVDPFSQRFIKPWEKQLRRDKFYEDDLHLVIWINYDENPLFPESLEQERQYDQDHLSSALYRHIWLGEYYDEVEDTIIPVEWFDAAIDAHVKLGFKPEGAVICAFDPSDEGGDSKGIAIRQGSVVLDVDEMTHGDAGEGMDWAILKARNALADWFVWDCDGLGVSLKREADRGFDGGRTQLYMFKGSESPEDADALYLDGKRNRDVFYNKRAQYYWRLRERFENTYKAVTKGQYINPDDMISISSNMLTIDQLRSEVCRIPQKRNNNGKIQIMSKLDMAKKPYELPSPNMADALMMSMYAPTQANTTVKIRFKGWN